MDIKDKYIDAQKSNDKIQNKRRGQILYYSIEQVADLLNEDISNIKYYTNIFDNLLKIEIIDKELRYTNSDVDNLELLIKFKNKGMSLKEIEDYYNKLPLNDTETQPIETNLLSVEELIDSIKKEQQDQLNNFKAQLINDIQKSNSLYLQNITSTIIETQTKNLNEFRESLIKEVKEYLNYKFYDINETSSDLHDKLLTNTTEFISEKLDNKYKELKTNLQRDFDTFTQSSLTINERLIKEVKDFKRVIHNAYYTQSEIEKDTANMSFWGKLIQGIKTN